jgi:sporulation transcriptional regulator SpoIIID
MNHSVILKDYIENRVYEIAQYILDTNCTVRAAAKKFEVSKSTVHKDLVDRLPHLNSALAEEVRKVLDENKAERHIRGGLATKAKYEAVRRREISAE